MIRQLQDQVTSETVCRPLSEAELSVSSPVTILVVESNRLLRSALRQGLRENGFVASVAADGPEAIALYQAFRGRFDLVLTEFQLPGQDGIEVVKALDAIAPIARLCFTTSDAHARTLTKLTSIGALYVFVKPFLVADLFEKLLFLTRLSASPLTLMSGSEQNKDQYQRHYASTKHRPADDRSSASFRMAWQRGLIVRILAAITRLCVWLPRRRPPTQPSSTSSHGPLKLRADKLSPKKQSISKSDDGPGSVERA